VKDLVACSQDVKLSWHPSFWNCSEVKDYTPNVGSSSHNVGLCTPVADCFRVIGEADNNERSCRRQASQQEDAGSEAPTLLASKSFVQNGNNAQGTK